MPARLTDLLKIVKPERALFTTFTLSLGWFEAFCLPILKLEGCEQIDLFVDSREACKLGAETTSAYAGTAFRIVSVYMNKAGFFHPKIAYLQGEQDDTLVVGSGNLTQPGQGGNLEVIDAINASQHPQVFEEFADFADLFAQRPGLSHHSASILKQYANRAREVAAKASISARNERRSAWLVHTLEEPAQEQLGNLVKCELENPSELTVLSPFHSPSAEAVAKLARSCGGLHTHFGLIPVWSEDDKAHLHIAPFEQGAKNLPKKSSFVTAITGGPPRKIHAKCFEVKGENAYLVMTGSVNATHQSLCETRNVEISLVRKLAESPFRWKTMKPDAYIPFKYEDEPASGSRGTVDASWTDKKIVGVLTPNNKERYVRLEVWSKHRCEFSIDDVSLDMDGHFEATTCDSYHSDYALRIKIIEDVAVLGTGWLNIENALAFPPNDRDLARAANSITSGIPTERDLRAILEHFRKVLRHDRTLTRSATSKSGEVSKAATQVSTPKPFDHWPPSEQKQLGVSPKTARQILAAAFASLKNPVTQAGQHEATQTNRTGTQQNREAPKTTPAHSNKIRRRRAPQKRPGPDNATAEMLKMLPVVLKVNATGPWMPSLIGVSLGKLLTDAVNSLAPNTLLENNGQPLLGIALCQWLNEYSHYDYSDANRARLIDLFCGAAACAVFFGGESVNPPRLKQTLETFRQSTLTSEEWLYLADSALALQPFEAINEATRKLVLEGALTLADTLLAKHELESLVIATFSEGTTAERRFPRHQKIQDQLRTLRKNQLRSGKPGRLFGIISENNLPLEINTRCPACDVILGTLDMIAQLSRDGVALHASGCSKPVFIGLDRAKLDAAHIARTLYGFEGPHLKE